MALTLFNSENFSDLKLQILDKTNQTEIFAHSQILINKSLYFESLYNFPGPELLPGEKRISVLDISGLNDTVETVLKIIEEFMYDNNGFLNNVEYVVKHLELINFLQLKGIKTEEKLDGMTFELLTRENIAGNFKRESFMRLKDLNYSDYFYEISNTYRGREYSFEKRKDNDNFMQLTPQNSLFKDFLLLNGISHHEWGIGSYVIHDKKKFLETLLKFGRIKDNNIPMILNWIEELNKPRR